MNVGTAVSAVMAVFYLLLGGYAIMTRELWEYPSMYVILFGVFAIVLGLFRGLRVWRSYNNKE